MRLNFWITDKGGVNYDVALVNNFTATVDPVGTNDSSQGYTAGSTWLNVTGQRSWICVSNGVGAAVWIQSAQTAGSVVAPAATTATGNGSAASVTGGSGGTTSGNGGPANVTGGAATAGNGNGGSVVLTGGAKNGTGIAGGVRVESLFIKSQGTPAAATTSATLTAANILSGIVTVLQGAGGASAQQLPLGTALAAALPADFAVNDSFDISVINLSTTAAEVATITTNTGMTLVGSMDFAAHAAATTQSQGMLRFRLTAANVFSVYRIA